MIFSGEETIEKKLSFFKKSIKAYKVTCDVQQIKHAKKDKIQKFLQPNCVVGHHDDVPGIVEIPKSVNLDSTEFNQVQTAYGHKLKIDGLEKIDALFQKYLKASVETTGYTASIASRKITCTPSNSTSLLLQS